MQPHVILTLADSGDVNQIAALVSGGSFQNDGSGALLPLSAVQIAQLVSEGRFAVARVDGHIAGCVSLVEYSGIAELRSLVVAEAHRSHGIGSQLARWCIAEAARRGRDKLFALTNNDAIPSFTRLGFVKTDRPPEKLSRDCQACPLFHSQNCKEIPLVLAVAPVAKPFSSEGKS